MSWTPDIVGETLGEGAERQGGTVLVTGASGFVGKALVPMLAASGYRVVRAGRAGSAASPATDRLLPDPDSAADGAFDALLDGIDHVVHLAGIAHTRLTGDAATKAYLLANYLLPRRLSEAAHRRLPGKLVFMSSVRAQCGPSHHTVLTEHMPARPKDDYGRAKLAAEKAIAKAMPNGNFSILRPTLVYGPGAKGNFGFLKRIAALPVPLPFAALNARRSLLALEGLCDAIRHCLVERRTDGETFLVCDDEPLAVHEIIAEMRRGLGMRPWLFSVPPALTGLGARLIGQSERWRVLSEDLVVDCSHLCRTGWRPISDSRRAIRESVAEEHVRP